MTGEQAAGQHEQVVELERAGGRPLAGAVEHEAGGHRADHQPPVLAPDGETGVDGRGEVDLLGAQALEGLDAEGPPLLLVAGLGGERAAHRLRDRPAWRRRRRRGPGRWPRRTSAATRPPAVSPGGVGVQPISAARSARSARPERRPRGRRGVDPRLDEVPVGLEVLHDAQQPAQDLEPLPVAELDESGRGEAGPDLVVGVVEQAVEQVVPPLVEGELALQLVEHGEAGRQARPRRGTRTGSSGRRRAACRWGRRRAGREPRAASR